MTRSASPFTKAGTFGQDDWSQVNRDLIWDGSPSGACGMTLLSHFLEAQGEMQRATFALVGVDALVDTLMAHAGLFVDQKIAADLLRTPGLFQF